MRFNNFIHSEKFHLYVQMPTLDVSLSLMNRNDITF